MRIRSVAIGAAASAFLLLAACVAGRPVHYYTINPLATPVAPAKPDGPVLLIGRITAPGALQDGRIQYRAGSNEVGAYEYHRWSERPAVMVQNQLLQALLNCGKFRDGQESSTTAAGDYLLRGRLNEFAELDNSGIQTRVSLRLELADPKTGSTIWAHDYSHDEPVSGKTMTEVVSSIEQNLQHVLGEAAAITTAFPNPLPPPGRLEPR